eukprot:gene38774-biopygen30826
MKRQLMERQVEVVMVVVILEMEGCQQEVSDIQAVEERCLVLVEVVAVPGEVEILMALVESARN